MYQSNMFQRNIYGCFKVTCTELAERTWWGNRRHGSCGPAAFGRSSHSLATRGPSSQRSSAARRPVRRSVRTNFIYHQFIQLAKNCQNLTSDSSFPAVFQRIFATASEGSFSACLKLYIIFPLHSITISMSLQNSHIYLYLISLIVSTFQNHSVSLLK